jgi:hypothetical protein
MRKLVTAFAVATLGIAQANAVIAQQRQTQLEALPEASRVIIETWLQRDCNVGASEEELKSLRSVSGIAQGVLIEAYEQGPPPEVERQYEAAFSAAYDARSNALAREGEQLFGAEDAANLKNVDRESYMRRRLEAARINYRTNAVLGLGVVGARDALPLLNKIAAEPTNPVRQAARDAISALGEKSPDQQSP